MQQGGTEGPGVPYWALGASQFGKRVRAQREGAGFTQRELSENLAELGVKLDTSAITRIENGSREPRLKEAAAIAHALGVSLSALIHFDENPISALFSAYEALNIATQDLDRAAGRAYSAADALQTVVIRSDVKAEVAQQAPTLDLGVVVERCSDAIDHIEDVHAFVGLLNSILERIERIPGFSDEIEMSFDESDT
ncbi:helix-turn-helix domain-containing protein [Mycolicibacterium lutetiense]|uniref:Transcriptional regulator with XRE-family HTH domain n=1 Tax=Mycolicibacterium lutetiense TaxID=1641992 RepID=A0ABS5A1P4_9MYCO|nr:helix-turn-helix transcriptional regulator [Mycolicibacterium lutetiense]MBP2455690.1 transcriptional regulator with XRE-family HTH domain [Mycolicibacterium lutetiense]